MNPLSRQCQALEQVRDADVQRLEDPKHWIEDWDGDFSRLEHLALAQKRNLLSVFVDVSGTKIEDVLEPPSKRVRIAEVKCTSQQAPIWSLFWYRQLYRVGHKFIYHGVRSRRVTRVESNRLIFEGGDSYTFDGNYLVNSCDHLRLQRKWLRSFAYPEMVGFFRSGKKQRYTDINGSLRSLHVDYARTAFHLMELYEANIPRSIPNVLRELMMSYLFVMT